MHLYSSSRPQIIPRRNPHWLVARRAKFLAIYFPCLQPHPLRRYPHPSSSSFPCSPLLLFYFQYPSTSSLPQPPAPHCQIPQSRLANLLIALRIVHGCSSRLHRRAHLQGKDCVLRMQCDGRVCAVLHRGGVLRRHRYLGRWGEKGE